MVVGRFNHILDEKHRLRISPAFKPYYIGKLMLVMSVNGCISVYTENDFKEMIKIYEKAGTYNAKAQAAYTALLGMSYECVTDKQDRILIPDHLCKYAGILQEKDGTIVYDNQISSVGKVNHIEIWNTKRLDAFTASLNFDEVFANLNAIEENYRGE